MWEKKMANGGNHSTVECSSKWAKDIPAGRMTNERLLSRIHHVQKLLKKYQNESRMFIEERNKNSGNFREVELPLVCEVASNCSNKETGESSSFSDTTSSLLIEQDTTTEVSALEVVAIDAGTSPPLMSSSTTISSKHEPVSR